MNDRPSTFLTTPVAILLSAFVISISVLIHGGIIKIGGLTTTGTQVQQAAVPVQPAAPAAPAKPTVTQGTIKALFSDKNIVYGKKDAKNLLVEVADPSCPYCQVAAGHNGELNKQVGTQFTLVSDGGAYIAPVPEMKKLVDSGEAAFVFIYSPGHGNGEMGTKAMYCANEKGKFWEVHDKLMTSEGYDLLNNTVKNDKTKAEQLATFLSGAFNSAEMQSCLESGKYDSKISEDTATASSLGITGTPGFFVNTTNFAGAYSWKDMVSAVQ